MKTMIRLLSLAALAATFTLPVLAQDAAPAAQNICEEAARGEMYTKYYNLKKGGAPEQKQAYDIAKSYAQKYATCNDQYLSAVQKFIKAYDEASAQAQLPAVVLQEKNYQKAFQIGRQILATTPDDQNTMMYLAYAGYQAYSAKDNAYNTDALNYARKILQQVDGGRAPANWAPFKNRDEALGYLNYWVGEFTLAQDPAGATPYYVKAVTLESPVKNSAFTYGRLATAYQVGQYDKLQKTFNEKFGGKDETEESRFALNNLSQVIDRIIDAYARAVNLAGNDPALATYKAQWQEQLTNFYKFRHENKTDGLEAYIASVVNTPLPAPFTPQPFVPSTPPATSTGDGATATVPPPTPAAPAAPAAPKPAMATTPTTARPAPTATPTPAKPATANTTPTKKPPVKRQHH